MILMFCLLIISVFLIIMDIMGKIDFFNTLVSGIWIFVFSHSVFFTNLYFDCELSKFGFGIIVLWIVYGFLRITFMPVRKKSAVNLRLCIMIGGRRIIRAAWAAVFFEVIFYYIVLYGKTGLNWSNKLLITDGIVCFIVIMGFFYNGCIRIICTSKWLGVIKRAAAFFLLPVPFVNIYITSYLCSTAYYENDYTGFNIKYKLLNYNSDTCRTKYPLLMVHGVGFRDFRFFNYWGRIPYELKRLGAEIYYANQEAFGTIEYNGEDIKKRILEIVEQTGAEKVNIIAHSKGGLDARYVISSLGMEDYVASLTTISTPHRGVKPVDYCLHLPDKVYRLIAFVYDSYFKKLGDKNPDFYNATRAFATSASKEFNEKNKDSNKVYYQSYTSVLKNIFSDYILFVPYIINLFTDGNNDGLVSIESAKWGEFRGVLQNKYRRGISHGDIIDLKREDYRGFDVVEWYVEIVEELKEKGF